MFFAHRERTDRRLNRLEDALAETGRELAAVKADIATLKAEGFQLEEMRRQARNAVRSLERAAANAQEPLEPTNGKGRGVRAGPPAELPPLPPPGPRRNY